MVPPHEVVVEFNHALHIIWIVFLQKEEKLSFNCCLVVVLLLVFHDFNSNRVASFVVDTTDHTAKSTFADYFLHLVAISNLVTFIESVIALVIIETVIH
jgi:hypothetical protein